MIDSVIFRDGYDVIEVDEIDSTNDEARRCDAAGARAGTVIWARRQSAGRGRHGRRWTSPEGNLYFSILLHPHCPPGRAAELSFLTIVALGETIAALPGAAWRIGYKWPNDLLLNGRKAAGILLESASSGGVIDRLIIGIGVNIASFPGDTAFPATSLAAAGWRDGDPRVLLDSYLRHFDRWLAGWRADGFAPARAAWLERAEGLGRSITLQDGDRRTTGIFQGISAEGGLEILDPSGVSHVMNAGDVFFERAPGAR